MSSVKLGNRRRTFSAFPNGNFLDSSSKDATPPPQKKKNPTHGLQFCILTLRTKEIEDDIENSGQEERQEQVESGEIHVALRT